MGNSFESKSNLLARNWAKVNSSTYRNIITEELIDEHLVQYQSEEEMLHHHVLLMKRANLTHPNTLKLIYFYQENKKGICLNNSYSHRIFIEHHQQHLDQLMDSTQKIPYKGECFCCSIVSGLAHLVQKYGYFLIKQTMILVCVPTHWQKNGSKRTAKVWINSQLKSSEPQIVCTEEEMCRKISIIFKRMKDHNLCSKFQLQEMNQIDNIDELISYMFTSHSQNFMKDPQPKKRVLSTTMSYTNPTFYTNDTNMQTNESTQNLHLQNKPKTFHYYQPKQIPMTQRDRMTGDTSQLITNKTMVSPSPSDKKVTSNRSNDQLKPQTSAFKVNFSYTGKGTPKQNRSYQQAKFYKPVTTPSTPIRKVDQPKPNIFINPNIAIRQKNQIVPSKPAERVEIKEQVIQQQIKQSINEEDLRQKLQQIVTSQRQIQIEPRKQIIPLAPIQSPEIVSLQKLVEIKHDEPQPYIVQEQSKQVLPQREIVQNIFSSAKQVQSGAIDDFEQQMPGIKVNEVLKPEDIKNVLNDYQIIQQQPYIPDSQPQPQQFQVPLNYVEVDHLLMRSDPINQQKINHQLNSQKHERNYILPSFQEDQRWIKQSSSSNHELDSKYNKYLQNFQDINKKSSSSKNNPNTKNYFSKHDSAVPQTRQIYNSNQTTQREREKLHKTDSFSKNYNTSRQQQTRNYNKNRLSSNNDFVSRQPEIVLSHNKQLKSGQIESMYNQSEISQQEDKKAKIIQRIQNTQKVIRQNRKKLEKIQLQKDLEREKQIIKKQMDSLLKNNLMSDQSHRIKQKVKYKKATFAQLKAQASKILQDLNF